MINFSKQDLQQIDEILNKNQDVIIRRKKTKESVVDTIYASSMKILQRNEIIIPKSQGDMSIVK